MSRLSVILLLLLSVLLPVEAARPARTVKNVKKEQQGNRSKINDTRRQLKDNTRRTAQELNRLNSLRADIDESDRSIEAMRLGIDSLDAGISGFSDSIVSLETRLDDMRRRYVASLRKMQGTSSSTGTLAFLFSSGGFRQAWQRVRYLREVNRWRARQAGNLLAASEQLKDSREKLAAMQRERSDALSRMSLARRQLQFKSDESSRLVADMKKRDGDLRALLQKQQRQQKSLDAELNSLIRHQQSKPKPKPKSKDTSPKSSPGTEMASVDTRTGSKSPGLRQSARDRELSGSFEGNKGRLLFPVAGSYRVVKDFGRHHHPDLPHVMVDNPGIDVEVAAGTAARAVFEGIVSAIFRQDGFGNIVMVRHGNYINIYANLCSISVRTGVKVSTGQRIGGVATVDGHTILHFEVRNERSKLNPMSWVR